MPRNPEEQAKWEQQCFGCSLADHRAGIDRLVENLFGNTNLALGSILSDVQELIGQAAEYNIPLIAERSLEQARQHLNRVKDCIFDAAPIELWKRPPDETA